MMEYTTLELITSGKNHPEIHCDTQLIAEHFFIFKPNQPCPIISCPVSLGGYTKFHHKCILHANGLDVYVCECLKGPKETHLSFYARKESFTQFKSKHYCWWCVNNCLNTGKD